MYTVPIMHHKKFSLASLTCLLSYILLKLRLACFSFKFIVCTWAGRSLPLFQVQTQLTHYRLIFMSLYSLGPDTLHNIQLHIQFANLAQLNITICSILLSSFTHQYSFNQESICSPRYIHGKV